MIFAYIVFVVFVAYYLGYRRGQKELSKEMPTYHISCNGMREKVESGDCHEEKKKFYDD